MFVEIFLPFILWKFREQLRIRGTDQHLFYPKDVPKPRLSLALRPRIHAIAEGARAAARRWDRPNRGRGALFQDARKDLEAGAAENLGDVLHLDRIAQVRLVGSVFCHRLAVRDARKLRRHRLAAAELLEHAAQHRFDRGEHILLRDEAHLDVELVELAGRAVGARVLVAKARRNLEVAVEAGDHDQLLELLWRLRQGVELPRMQARRHEIVARALGRGGGEDRRLEFEEALLLHPPPQRIDDVAALHDVAVQALAAQVEETVFEPDLLGIFLVAEDRQRQFAGPSQNFDLAGVDLDRPGRQIGVLGAVGPRAYLAVDAHHPFRSAAFRRS